MLLRCSGTILRVDAREGVSATTNKPWRIPFVAVLVENQGVAEVNVPESRAYQFEAGQAVDFLVDVETQGRYLSCRYVSDLLPLHLAAPVASGAKSS